jgi:nitroreductase/NAD-dependent dihydropyrimidine dehydrogenase PreA subunit
MKIIEIDRNACTGCLLCVKECPAGLFTVNGSHSLHDVGISNGSEAAPGAVQKAADRQSSGYVVRRDPNGWCTGCGHCICVCQANAIRFEANDALSSKKLESLASAKEALMSEDGSSFALKTWEFEGVSDPPSLCSYDTILKFLSSKRSVRHYTGEEIPKEMIETVLYAMRYAPTGHNLQANRYLVIRDPERKRRIVEETAKGFKRFKTLIRLRTLLRPFISGPMYEMLSGRGLMAGLDDLISKCRADEDPILHSAPVVVISYYPSLGPLSFIDPSISFTYGMLAAHALGLGTCWIGFAIQALWKNKRMKRYLGVPKGMTITGVMTLGYPAVRYVRVPPRNAAAVSRL